MEEIKHRGCFLLKGINASSNIYLDFIKKIQQIMLDYKFKEMKVST